MAGRDVEIAGDRSIARRLYNPVAAGQGYNIGLLGTSLSMSMFQYMSRYMPGWARGYVSTGNAGFAGAVSGTYGTTTNPVGHGTVGTSGLGRAFTAAYCHETVFNGAAAATYAPGFLDWLQMRVNDNQDPRIDGTGTSWTRKGWHFTGTDILAAGGMYGWMYCYQNPSGVNAKVRTSWVKSSDFSRACDLGSPNLNGTAGLVKVGPVACDFTGLADDKYVRITSQVLSGVTPPNGSNFIMVAAGLENPSIVGHLIHPLCIGGWNTTRWLDDRYVTQQAINEYATVAGIDCWIVELYINGSKVTEPNPVDGTGGGSFLTTKAEFAPKIAELTTRLRTAAPNAAIVYMTTWPLAASTQAPPYYDAVYEQCLATPGSLYLNGHAFLGGEAMYSPTGHLTDGVHPSVQGTAYFLPRYTAKLAEYGTSRFTMMRTWPVGRR